MFQVLKNWLWPPRLQDERGAGGMTLGAWKKLGLPMQWSIFKEQEFDQYKSQNIRLLDLRSTEPDGTYDVLYPYSEGREEDSRTSGVIVRNGEFDPESTARACLRAVLVGCYGDYTEPQEAVRIDHKYIESLSFNWKRNAFELTVGS